MNRHSAPSVRALLALTLSVILVSCGSGSPAAPSSNPDDSDPNPDDPGPADPDALECESQDYPCSFAEVPRAILERSDALGDEALAMLESGGSSSAVASWLEQQADVAEVQSDAQAIRFRIEGGRNVWILRESLFPGEGPGAAAPSAPSATTPARHVVSEQDEQKRALVLSPFYWEFPNLEDGGAVSGILSGTRGYQGRVEFYRNEEQASSEVSLASFTGWEDYEVIHVSTHGKRVCDANGCRATILAGLLDPALPGQEPWEQLLTLNQEGVEYAKGEETGREYLVLSADFFRAEYPSGLDDALVFFNACQSFGAQATDLVEAIQGQNTVVLGWSETVFVSDATATAVALYEELGEKGFPAEVAVENLGALKQGQPVPDFGVPELRLEERRGGGDIRIRDVVRVLNPSSGQILTSADQVGIIGTADDGIPDAAPYLVRVDGVTEEDAANVTVRVTIDGTGTDPIPLTDGNANEDGQWTLSGEIALPYDLEGDRSVVFQARAQLHSGGESDHEVSATLTGEEPIMGTVWEMEADYVARWVGAPFPTSPVTASGSFILRREEGQPTNEPRPRFVVVGGSVSFDYNHVYGSCSFSAPVLNFEVTPEMMTGSHVTFDTTIQPVRYTGWINLLGPFFDYESACEDSNNTREGRANIVWLDVDDPRPISADGESLTGTRQLLVDFDAFDYEQVVDYTITRIE